MATGARGSSAAAFVSKAEGEYTLQGGRSKLKGKYRFEPTTGELVADGEAVGVFSCNPIAEPFPDGFLEGRGTQSIPCIRVIKGEIMEDIQDEQNHGAFFVLPSQLNGAEYPSDRSVVTAVDDYKYDNTGGPRGQLAVHPAAAQFVLDNAACDGREGGLNAIDEILRACGKAGAGFQLQNGYLRMPCPDGEAECQKALQAFVGQLHTLRPLIMQGVPACGLTPCKEGLAKHTHQVGLVYASAVPVDSYCNRARPGSPAAGLHGRAAEAVLVAQYYGAMAEVAKRTTRGQKTTVYLLPLGGGVFNNPFPSIVRAMSLAVELLQERGLLERLDVVALAWRGSPREYTVLTDLLGRMGKLA